MPTEAEMLPKNKYTIFDRKAKKYRKGIHSMFLSFASVYAQRDGGTDHSQNYRNGREYHKESILQDTDSVSLDNDRRTAKLYNTGVYQRL